MSEFAGIVAFDGSGVARDHLEALANAVSGARTQPISVHASGNAAFAFRQRVLAPEDLFEHQPAVGPESGVVSMFDGRLDNRDELLDALCLKGRGNTPVPDGTIVRVAYERWGEGAPERLLGDFAWGLWDSRAGKLVLARDHSVQRALFFCRTDRFVAFATGYAPLLALPGVSHTPDAVAIARLLAQAPDEHSRTLFKSIHWVGSASCVTLTGEAIRERRYWEPAARDPLPFRSDGEVIEAARAVFDSAVASRLRVEGPVVSSISGGLDSSAVAATAARMAAPAVVHGLCMVPRADSTTRDSAVRYASEAPLVAEIAAGHTNLQVEYLDQGYADSDAIGLVPKISMPLRAPGQHLWFAQMNRRAATLGASTLLTGGFGNYTFSAMGEDEASARLRESDFAGLARMVATPEKRGLAVRRVARAMLPRPTPRAHQSAMAFAPIHPEFARAHGIEALFERDSIVRLGRAGGEPRERILRYVTMRARLQMESTAVHRRLYGITTSDPFSDRRVIDFCMSLPSDQFCRGNETRRLARRAFADRLPAAVLTNTRKGIQDPEWHWRLTTERERIEAAFDRFDRSALVASVLDVPRMRGLLRALPEKPAAGEHPAEIQTLERALQIGAFLAWAEGEMPKPDSPAVP